LLDIAFQCSKEYGLLEEVITLDLDDFEWYVDKVVSLVNLTN